MRSMRTTISLVLVVIMVLGLAIPVYADNADDTVEITFKDESKITNKQAVEYFVKTGVINGYSDGTFNPTGTLKRSEAAKIIAAYKQGLSESSVDFADFDESHWAFNYVSYCVDRGYIVGHGGSYHPDEVLTGYAWAKIVICSLGYDAEAYGLVGNTWKSGVDKLAKELNLLSKLTNTDLDAGITREDACQLLYNSLAVTTLGHYASSIDEINRIYNNYKLDNSSKYYGSLRDWAEDDLSVEADFATSAEGFAGGAAKNDSVAMGANTSSNSPEYSKTNVQVNGIDEGDIVKTDGRYIYYAHSSENHGEYVINVVDTKDGTKIVNSLPISTETISIVDSDGVKIDLDYDSDYGTGILTYKGKEYSMDELEELGITIYLDELYNYLENIYIVDSKLVVIYDSSKYSSMINLATYDYNDYYFDDITYVEVYDISDVNNIKLIYTFGQDGNLQDTRLIDNKLYAISSTYDYGYYYDYDNTKDFEDYIPKIYINNKGSEIPVNHIYITEATPCFVYFKPNYSLVTCFDLTLCNFNATEAILGEVDIVYMNYDYLYLARESRDYSATKVTTESIYTVTTYKYHTLTSVFKYDLSNGLRLAATTEIPGYLDGQFSLDEYEGNLRAVTHKDDYEYQVYVDEERGFTNYKYPEDNNDTSNAVYTYDKNLNPLGELKGLAKDENVYSVRFDKDVVYFCTYRQVDPLFSVDLTDPANPKLMGALKITGFSEYLHNWSDNLLLGFGYSATEQGRTTGLQLVMFDTSNKFDVTVKDTIALSADYSAALHNHRALLVDTAKGLIGIPTEKGYEVYTYTEQEGFKRVALIENSYYNWRSSSRAVYIGNLLYILDEDFIQTLDMKNFELVSIIDYSNTLIDKETID